jgi:hypothetical protein
MVLISGNFAPTPVHYKFFLHNKQLSIPGHYTPKHTFKSTLNINAQDVCLSAFMTHYLFIGQVNKCQIATAKLLAGVSGQFDSQ